MKYFLGIDGGGTKTRALLVDETGAEVAYATGKGINYNSIGIPTARKYLKEVTDQVLRSFSTDITAAVIGCAALSGRADKETTQALCSGIIPCGHIVLDSDVSIALLSAPDPAPKAIAICGTGSMAAALSADGRRLTAGGWGYLLGDEGSGYAIAMEGIKSAICSFEKHSEPSALEKSVKSHFHLNGIPDLIDLFYNSPLSRDLTAGFAPTVRLLAENGDPEATYIIHTQAKAFADTVHSLLLRLPASAPLYLWGGIFEHNPCFRTVFTECILREHPDTPVSMLPVAPVRGAALAALGMVK